LFLAQVLLSCSLYTAFSYLYVFNFFVCGFLFLQFCIHGPFCRYKHIRRPREDLPAVADFTLGLSQMQANSKDQNSGGGGGGPGDRRGGEQQQNQTKRPAPKPNEFYKISLCKHFLNGDCPFGEGCHFAHGEHELRTFPRGSGGGSNNQRNEDDEGDNNDEGEGDYYGDNDGHGGGGASSHRLSDNMFSNHENTTVDYYTGGASGGGRPTPIVEPEQAHFFIVRAATLNDLVRR
jgi:Zinc finger C-x8-C-x5-C-x3-H type (and similar)